MPSIVFAGASSLAMVSGRYYYSLEDVIANAGSNDTIKLISDVKLDDIMDINININININGNDITGKSMVFKINGGVLNVRGSGAIREIEPNYGAIAVIGSTDSLDINYSIVNVGKDVNLYEDINAINDVIGSTGIGVYVNGNIKYMDNSPVVNIVDDSDIIYMGDGTV